GALPADQRAVLRESAGDVAPVGRTAAQRGGQAVLEHSALRVREDGILARYHASQGTWRGPRVQSQGDCCPARLSAGQAAIIIPTSTATSGAQCKRKAGHTLRV